MATLKQIRQRIKTAKNIQQITRAMKLVAAARLTRAKNRVEEARPYSQKMREFIGRLGPAGELVTNPLLNSREIKKYCLLLITAERGLCGSFNTALLRKASEFLKETPGESSLVCVGKKGATFFAKRGYNVVKQVTVPTAGAKLEDAVVITNLLRKMFESGEVDAVYLCYSRFYSPIRQEPQVVPLLPIEPIEGVATEESNTNVEYRFEPQPKDLLELLLPKYLLTLVWQTLLESAASEHGARMTAMSNATENAGKMIDTLTLTANRARQASITKEILEIVAGANALQG